MPSKSAALISVGIAVPDNVLTNEDLAKKVDTSDEWIRTRTGISERRIVAQPSHTDATRLGAAAGAQALERAGVDAADVDTVICATFTPDSFFPSTACRIQHELGCVNAFAFDILAACSGFVYGLSIANALVCSGQSRTVLLIGSEVISKTLDWTDRSTCILFGDGAGAAVIQAVNTPDTGILATYTSSKGDMGDILYCYAWGDDRTMRMKGNEVFKHAVRLMSNASQVVCERAGVSIDDVDLFVPHQANMRIIKGLAEKLGIPAEKVVSNIERYGNTSSASIPLALDEAWRAGRVKPGSLILFAALGGGVTIGSALVRI